MKTHLFGPTGIAVPVIGQGTWEMQDDDRDACIEALRVGADAGMTHIDTAEMYGDGYVEENIVAEAIAGRRDQLFLASKVLPDHASFAGTIAACERSLRRLRTDRLDLYYLHWRGRYPLEETFGAFERLREDGKIRAYAVSNFDTAALEEALAASASARFAADQVLYHLEERAAEQLVLPACEAAGLAMVAYSPFGHGKLPWLHAGAGRVLVEIAREHDITPGAVVLAFITRRERVFAIPKAASREHALANAAGGELRLGPEELARIDEAYRPGAPLRELPML